MIKLRTKAIERDWVRQVRDSLLANGYHYQSAFCSDAADDPERIVTAARLLGVVYTPADTDPNKPVVLTQPSSSAPKWRPFDRRPSIGWHNDFSTCSKRPRLSLSWIERGDPSGPIGGGAWRVASVKAVIEKLRETRDGNRLVADLTRGSEAFGYHDAGSWRPFRVIIRRALKEGAMLRYKKIPERTSEIVARVEEAADAVGEVLPATNGALLIVDNRLSLHDRLEQQVTGPRERRRRAWLCFVQSIHQPL